MSEQIDVEKTERGTRTSPCSGWVIDDFIDYIKEQVGVDLLRDDYFNGIDYFCVDVGERLWLSQKFNRILRLSKNGNFRVEPNGLSRIAIFGYNPNERGEPHGEK